MKPTMKAALLIGALLCISSQNVQPAPRALAPLQAFDGSISVLTYNVHGLPWPVVEDRDADLESIAGRLRHLRDTGSQPSVVVLQEAFTTPADRIGRAAGYRYVVRGPGAGDVNHAPMSVADRKFADGAHWWKGETEGKLLGSGLMILSDYPIQSVSRMAYPVFACAGYDCLANKGALMVRIQPPGGASAVEIATTHLNSRHSSGVADDRSFYAYQRQAYWLSAFIKDHHDPALPLVLAGDFNIGSAVQRRTDLLRSVDQAVATNGGARDALRQLVSWAARHGRPIPPDAATSLQRARDWEFFTPGKQAVLTPMAIRIPFGKEIDGRMLSDHIGYVSQFRLDRSGHPLA